MDQANRRRGMIRDQTGDSPHRSGRIISIEGGKAGIGSGVRAFAAIADEVAIVTIPEPTAIAGAYAYVKSLAEPAGGVSLLVNLADSAALATRVFERFSATAARFAGVTVRDAGDLPRDLAVARSVQNRVPFVNFGTALSRGEEDDERRRAASADARRC